MEVESDAPLKEGSALTSAKGGEEVGFVTSSSMGLALGYLNKRFVESGDGELIGFVDNESGEPETATIHAEEIRPPAYFEDPGAVKRAGF